MSEKPCLRHTRSLLNRLIRKHNGFHLASSVAQLQFTPWLWTGLAKEDIHFFPCRDDACNVPYHEPFVRQGFSTLNLATVGPEMTECNFTSLGILLLELCFGKQLEGHPLRKKHPPGTGEVKQAFDLLAANEWAQGVSDEGGEDYASAVKWCFFTSTRNSNDSWRGEVIKNVITPLQKCQEHFKAVAMT